MTIKIYNYLQFILQNIKIRYNRKYILIKINFFEIFEFIVVVIADNE